MTSSMIIFAFCAFCRDMRGVVTRCSIALHAGTNHTGRAQPSISHLVPSQLSLTARMTSPDETLLGKFQKSSLDNQSLPPCCCVSEYRGLCSFKELAQTLAAFVRLRQELESERARESEREHWREAAIAQFAEALTSSSWICCFDAAMRL